MFTLPTLLSYFRIFAVLLIIIFYYLPIDSNHLIATIIFIIAAVTDWLDGYLARNLSQKTRFGAFIDPVADKLLVALTLTMVVSQKYYDYIFLAVAIIIGREIVISALREWMAEIGKRTSVRVNKLGKYKTVLQMVAIGFLIFYKPGYSAGFKYIGVVLVYIAAILTIWSMFVYLKAAWPYLSSDADKA